MKMKWKQILALVAALAAGGALMAAQQSESESEPAQEEIEDFVPTEKVPAGGAISFPVDI